MKKNTDTFRAIADALCSNPSLSKAADDNGIGISTVFRWMKDCVSNPTAYEFEWGEYGVMNFNEAVKLAQKIANVLHVSEMRRRARFGTEEVVVFQGEVKYRVRLDIPPDMNDPDMLELLYGQRDRYQRDARGNLIPLTVTRAPSDAIQIAVARAYSHEFADRREISLQHSGGVEVIGRRPPPAPAAIPAPVVPRVIEEAVTETMIEEMTDEQLMPPPEPPELPEQAREVADISQGLDPVAVGEADMADGAAVPPIVADLQKKLAETLAKAAEKTKTAPTPQAGGYVSMRDRGEQWKYARHDTDEEDHVGRGEPKPGGAKTA